MDEQEYIDCMVALINQVRPESSEQLNMAAFDLEEEINRGIEYIRDKANTLVDNVKRKVEDLVNNLKEEAREKIRELIRNGNYIEEAQIIKVNEDLYDTEPVYFVNGVCNSRGDARISARELSQALFRPVYLIYNPSLYSDDAETAGNSSKVYSEILREDFSQALYDIIYPFLVLRDITSLPIRIDQHNRTTRQVTWALREATRSGKPISIVAHSQGSAIVRNAIATLAFLDDNGEDHYFRTKLKYVMVGSPVNRHHVWPNLGNKLTIIRNPQDPFPSLLAGESGSVSALDVRKWDQHLFINYLPKIIPPMLCKAVLQSFTAGAGKAYHLLNGVVRESSPCNLEQRIIASSGSNEHIVADDLGNLYLFQLGGKILQYKGESHRWTTIAENTGNLHIAVTGHGKLYLLRQGGLVFKYRGAPNQWQLIARSSDNLKISAGGSQLYLLQKGGEVLQYQGNPDDWMQIGKNSANRHIAAGADNKVYVLQEYGAITAYQGLRDGRHVWREIARNGDNLHIAAHGNRLFVSRADGNVREYQGTRDDSWVSIARNSRNTAICAGTNHVYLLQRDGTVLRYGNIPDYWQPAATPPCWRYFVVSGDNAYELKKDGGVMEHTATGEVRQIGSNEHNAHLAADNSGHVYVYQHGGIVEQYQRDQNSWSIIANNAINFGIVVTGNNQVYLYQQGGVVRQYQPHDVNDPWPIIANSTRNLNMIAGDTQLFIYRAGGQVFAYGGIPGQWQEIADNPANLEIVAGAKNKLYIYQRNGEILQYQGGNTWRPIPARAEEQRNVFLVAEGDHIYAVQLAGRIIGKHVDNNHWQEIGRNLENLAVAANSKHVYVLRESGIVTVPAPGLRANANSIEASPVSATELAQQSSLWETLASEAGPAEKDTPGNIAASLRAKM